MLDSRIGMMVRDVEVGRAGGGRRRDGCRIEQGVRDRTAEALVETDEDRGDLAAFGGQSIAIGAALPLDQAVGFQRPDVVAELGDGVRLGCACERLENGSVEVAGTPTRQVRAVVQKHLHEPHHAGGVNLDPRDTGSARGDRWCKALEDGKVDMDVEAIGVGRGHAVGHLDEPAAEGRQLVEALG